MIGALSRNDTVDLVRESVLRAIQQQRNKLAEQRLPDLLPDDERRLAASLTGRAITKLRAQQVANGVSIPEPDEDAAVKKAVLDSLFRLGPMQDLLDDPNIIEVNLIGCDQVWVSYADGRKSQAPAVMPNDDALVDWVRSQALYGARTSRPWDTSNPTIEFELNGGHRLVGLLGCSARPVISIRLLRRPAVTLEELRALDTFDENMKAFFQALVRARMNIMVSGETGSGKTTLLRALASEISPIERIVTIEHFPELGLDKLPERHPEVVALEELPANAEGAGGLTMTQLVRTSRRIAPDRLIVGECVGEEVVDMLDAMTQGNDGGFTTIHARSARKVPERIATYALRQGLSTEAALQLCASALDFVIHMAKVRLPDGRQRRLVTSVEEVIGFDGRQVMMTQVWALTPGGYQASPAAALSEHVAARLTEAGYASTAHVEYGRNGVLV